MLYFILQCDPNYIISFLSIEVVLFVTEYNDFNIDFQLFYYFYRRIKEEGLDKEDITELLRNKNMTKDLSYEIEFSLNHISELNLL